MRTRLEGFSFLSFAYADGSVTSEPKPPDSLRITFDRSRSPKSLAEVVRELYQGEPCIILRPHYQWVDPDRDYMDIRVSTLDGHHRRAPGSTLRDGQEMIIAVCRYAGWLRSWRTGTGDLRSRARHGGALPACRGDAPVKPVQPADHYRESRCFHSVPDARFRVLGPVGDSVSQSAERVQLLETTVHWLPDSSAFWYRCESASGQRFMLVEAATGRQQEAFDHRGVGLTSQQALPHGSHGKGDPPVRPP